MSNAWILPGWLVHCYPQTPEVDVNKYFLTLHYTYSLWSWPNGPRDLQKCHDQSPTVRTMKPDNKEFSNKEMPNDREKEKKKQWQVRRRHAVISEHAKGSRIQPLPVLPGMPILDRSVVALAQHVGNVIYKGNVYRTLSTFFSAHSPISKLEIKICNLTLKNHHSHAQTCTEYVHGNWMFG